MGLNFFFVSISWVQNFSPWFFRGSKIFSRVYFPGPKIFSRVYFHGPKIFSHGYFLGPPSFFHVEILWVTREYIKEE